MSVTIDYEPMAADELGLKTVGQVLTHVQRENRLVVNLLVDGVPPDLTRLGHLRAASLDGMTLFIETAEPRQMAMDVIDEVDSQLREADRLRTEAVDALGRNQPSAAMEKLSGCFSTWQNARESCQKTAQLLRIDLGEVVVEGRTFSELMADFTDQLRQIRTALEDRDFVTLSDILAYEATQTCRLWQEALAAVRGAVVAL